MSKLLYPTRLSTSTAEAEALSNLISISFDERAIKSVICSGESRRVRKVCVPHGDLFPIIRRSLADFMKSIATSAIPVGLFLQARKVAAAEKYHGNLTYLGISNIASSLGVR